VKDSTSDISKFEFPAKMGLETIFSKSAFINPLMLNFVKISHFDKESRW